MASSPRATEALVPPNLQKRNRRPNPAPFRRSRFSRLPFGSTAKKLEPTRRGYDAFTLDVTDAISTKSTCQDLTIRVNRPHRPRHPTARQAGRQTRRHLLHPNQRESGKRVWLEQVPETSGSRSSNLNAHPDGKLDVDFQDQGQRRWAHILRQSARRSRHRCRGTTCLNHKLGSSPCVFSPKELWSPESPFPLQT